MLLKAAEGPQAGDKCPEKTLLALFEKAVLINSRKFRDPAFAPSSLQSSCGDKQQKRPAVHLEGHGARNSLRAWLWGQASLGPCPSSATNRCASASL